MSSILASLPEFDLVCDLVVVRHTRRSDAERVAAAGAGSSRSSWCGPRSHVLHGVQRSRLCFEDGKLTKPVKSLGLCFISALTLFLHQKEHSLIGVPENLIDEIWNKDGRPAPKKGNLLGTRLMVYVAFLLPHRPLQRMVSLPEAIFRLEQRYTGLSATAKV